jgi:predicted transcriptional regulator
MLLKSINEISKIKGEFTISEDAKTLLIKWLRRHEDELEALDDSKGIMGFYARLSDYLLKFAMLYEISASRKLLISESSLMRAIKLVNQLKLSLNELMSNHIALTQEAKDMQKVLNIIKDNEQIPRGLLLRNSNMTSKRLDEVVRTLEHSGRIKSYFVNEGEKRTLVYTAIGS